MAVAMCPRGRAQGPATNKGNEMNESKLVAYAINERPGSVPGEKSKSFWTKIGTAFRNRDESITVYLNAVPVGNGKIQIRPPFPPREEWTRPAMEPALGLGVPGMPAMEDA
jgi:hypothetical protein